MFVSPSKLQKNKILRNRTLNFETVSKLRGNMIFVPSLSYDSIIKTFNSGLFRPMQLMASFTPRKYRPVGRAPVLVDQKNEYAQLRADTHGRFKKGKVNINAYNGQNIYYNLYDEYSSNIEVLSKIRKGIALQKSLDKFLSDKINSVADDPDYPKRYVVFPLDEYNAKLKQDIMTLRVPVNLDPMVLFLKELYTEGIDVAKASYSNIDLFIIYNPNANAMVVIDLNDPDLEKTKGAILLKILRLNAFNAKGAEHDDLVAGEDVDDGTDDSTLSPEDRIENKKEAIKTALLTKVAKKIHADNLTDFEAATTNERDLMFTIDDKVDKYLNKPENLKKTFADMMADVESDPDVTTKAIKYVETRKVAAQKMDNLAPEYEKETQVVGSISDLDDDSDVIEADKFDVNEKYIDDRVEESHLSSMDQEYNKKYLHNDIINVVESFTGNDNLPIAVNDVKFEDSSDERDMKKTMSVKFRMPDGKFLTFQIDIPDIYDKRYIYIGGNKKSIKKQLVRLPIVKTKNSWVEITTNYNKLTVMRTNGKISRKNAYLLKKLKDYTGNPHIKIEYGFNAIANSDSAYNNDFEYEELASEISKITTLKYEVFFNRPAVEREINVYDIPDDFFRDEIAPRTPLGFEKKGAENSGIIFISNTDRAIYRYDIATHDITQISGSLFDWLAGDVLMMDLSKLPSIGKSFVYTEVKFIGVKYPVLAVTGSLVGLTEILKRYNVKYKLTDKPIKSDAKTVMVKFKDKYLYYEETVRTSLLLNALAVMDADKCNYVEFDNGEAYTKYFMKIFGAALGMHVRDTLKINLSVCIDPITRDVLKDLKLPTDIVSVLLYANSLLVNNQVKPTCNLTNYRIRSNEIIADCLYSVLADAFVNYQRHLQNGRPINLKIGKRDLITKIIEQTNVNDNSTLNPVTELEHVAQASAKGFNGVNLNQAYNLEMRTYDDSMNGIISANATPYSGQAGITRSLAYDPMIRSVRGYVPDTREMNLSATNMLSPTELLASFTSCGADSPRQAMQVAQTGHSVPIMHPNKQLFGSGMNKTMAFLISDDFCFHAKKDGVVSKIDDANKLALLSYADGTRDAIDLSDKLDKNSNMGYYIHQNFKMCFAEGEHFKEGDILAYNPNFFTGKGKNVDYCPGALAKIAITSGDFSFEDSTLISDSLSKKCTTKVNMLKQVVLGKNAIIYKIAEPGSTIQSGDALLEFTSSYDDPDASEFIAKLADTVDPEYMNEVTHEEVKSKLSGTVTDVRVVYNCPFESLSESLQKLIKKYRGKISARKKALDGIKADSVHIPPLEQVSSRKDIKAEFPEDGGVIIDFWVEYLAPLDMGDKLTYCTALKGIVSRVVADDAAPMSEYRPEENVEGVLAATGVVSRMTSDVYKLMFSNKVLVNLGKDIREIWRTGDYTKGK